MPITSDLRCWICNSDNHIDNHHYDCLRGVLSPETVPLCRRCHQTYHIWGVGAFSPDTTEKALEVENKRRDILRSLPPDHPQYRRAEHLGTLSPLKLEDVKRSGYWYRKWGIKPPRKERIREKAVRFTLPKWPPLCGEDWLREHLKDHPQEEIGALAIVVSYGGRQLATAEANSKKGTLRKILREVEDGVDKS